MISRRFISLGLLVLWLLAWVAGCSTDRDQNELFSPEDINVLVIDAVLIVGQEFPDITLTRTQAPDVAFDLTAAAEFGAVITITGGGQTVVYDDSALSPGLYSPVTQGEVVQSGTEYLLETVAATGEILTASTLTPSPVVVDSWSLLDPTGSTVLRQLQTFATAGDSVYFRPENQITYAEGLVEARIHPGGPQEFGGWGYQLALFSIDLDSDYVIDPPFFDEEDFADLARSGSSPALNGEDGSLRLPWFGIYFEGRHLYKIFVLDQNWYDLLRSTPENDGGLGFGGNVGDSFARPLFNVTGGIGLFGSASVDSVGFYVHPQP